MKKNYLVSTKTENFVQKNEKTVYLFIFCTIIDFPTHFLTQLYPILLLAKQDVNCLESLS